MQVSTLLQRQACDGNSGSASRPWRTIQKGANTLRPGDTLHVRGGKYAEHVTINVSGTQGKLITLKNYKGERVTLDAGSITGFSRSYVRIEGFHILNTKVGRPAIEFHGNGGFVEIVGNEITGFKSRNAAALRVGGTMHHFVIDRNRVHHNATGVQEAIRVHERTHDFKILNNLVTDNTNIGIDVVGWAQFGKPYNGLIRGNQTHNNSTQGRWGAGIYLDGPDSIIVEYNVSSKNGIGIQFGCEPSKDSSKKNILRYNLVYDNREFGFSLGGYTGGDVHRCNIHNNVFVNNKREINFSTNSGHDNVILNNILYNPTGAAIVYLGKTKNTRIDFNCYFTRSGDKPGRNSIVSDPLFVNMKKHKLSLRPGSPCIDAGTLIQNITRDYAGNKVPQAGAQNRKAKTEIGAYEFSP